MTDQLARLAEVLGKRATGPWTSNDYGSGFNLELEQAVFLDAGSSNAAAICAAMNTIDALVEVAEAAWLYCAHDADCTWYQVGPEAMPRCDCGAYKIEQALATLDACIKEALK